MIDSLVGLRIDDRYQVVQQLCTGALIAVYKCARTIGRLLSLTSEANAQRAFRG